MEEYIIDTTEYASSSESSENCNPSCGQCWPAPDACNPHPNTDCWPFEQ